MPRNEKEPGYSKRLGRGPATDSEVEAFHDRGEADWDRLAIDDEIREHTKMKGKGKLEKQESRRDTLGYEGGPTRPDESVQQAPRGSFGKRGDAAGRVGKGRGWHGSPRLPVARDSKRGR